jgi:hypothetical protein
MKVGLGVTSIDSITLGDGEDQGERALSRRSVLKQSLRSGPLEVRRTAFSVALAIFWRMRGEVQRAGTVAPDHERYGSGLPDRPVGLERVARRHDHRYTTHRRT